MLAALFQLGIFKFMFFARSSLSIQSQAVKELQSEICASILCVGISEIETESSVKMTEN